MDPARIQCYAENSGSKQVVWRGQVMLPFLAPDFVTVLAPVKPLQYGYAD